MTDHTELLARLDKRKANLGTEHPESAATIRQQDKELERAESEYRGQELLMNDLQKELEAERTATGEAMDTLNEAGVPFEIHVEGGMCFTGLRPRIAWLIDSWKAARKAREEAERESKESEQLRFEENRRCRTEMDKRLSAEFHLIAARQILLDYCGPSDEPLLNAISRAFDE